MRTILLLASNPKGTHRLRLDEEVRRIEQVVERSRGREGFRIVVKWAVTDDDLRRGLLDHEPEIVHFLGHGTGPDGGESTRDLQPAEMSASGGLAFENPLGYVLTISADALSRLFELVEDQVRCVVLNACFSAREAESIARHIDYVIGMNQAIGDEAAVKFSVGFYDAVLAGKSYEIAFRYGCSAIDLGGIPEHLTPTLKRKKGAGSQPPDFAAPHPPATPSRPTPESSVVPRGIRTRPDPAPSKAPVPAIPPAELEQVRRALRRYIGPLADFIVDEHAKESRDVRDLRRRVSTEIESEDERRDFLRMRPLDA